MAVGPTVCTNKLLQDSATALFCQQMHRASRSLQAFIFVLCQTGLRLNLAKFLEWGPSRRMTALQVSDATPARCCSLFAPPVHLRTSYCLCSTSLQPNKCAWLLVTCGLGITESVPATGCLQCCLVHSCLGGLVLDCSSWCRMLQRQGLSLAQGIDLSCFPERLALCHLLLKQGPKFA